VSAEEKEAAAAEIAGERMHDGEREAGGYGGVDGVAARLEDLEAGIGGDMVNADDHTVFGASGLFAAVGDGVRGGVLGVDRGCCGEDEDGEEEVAGHESQHKRGVDMKWD
jgi:hypothetical protein